jgi:hypothetical protein
MENQPAGGSMRAPKERFGFVHEFLNRVFIDDLHAKRVLSLANATLEGATPTPTPATSRQAGGLWESEEPLGKTLSELEKTLSREKPGRSQRGKRTAAKAAPSEA